MMEAVEKHIITGFLFFVWKIPSFWGKRKKPGSKRGDWYIDYHLVGGKSCPFSATSTLPAFDN